MFAAFETANLLLQPFQRTDAPALFRFMNDARAMQHTYIAATLEQCSNRLSVYEDMRATLGFSPWVARVSEDTEPIGWGGLSVDPEEPEWGLEISHAFSPSTWGNGYATELVQASLAYAFGPLGVQEIHAFAKQENAASVRVLEKCGFNLLQYEPRLKRSRYRAAVPSAA